MQKTIFITGNKHKLEIANSIFSMYDIYAENKDIEPNEIQETDNNNMHFLKICTFTEI